MDLTRYPILGTIPYDFPTKSMRGIVIHDAPEFVDDDYGFIPSGEDRWASIMQTMETVK